MLKDLVYRVAGAQPESDAPRAEQLRWIRRLYRFNLGVVGLLVIFALTGGEAFLWILAGVVAVLWVIGLASISFSIHRADSADVSAR